MNRDVRKDYQSLLKDPRWSEFSSEVILHFHTCWQCGAWDGLQVHHLIYFKGRLPWEYDFKDLRVLCRECHQQVHELADMAWVEMLRLDKDQLYLLCKALAVIGAGDRGAITEKTVTLLRDVNTRRDQEDARGLLPTEWTDRSAYYAADIRMGNVGKSAVHGRRPENGDKTSAPESKPPTENSELPQVLDVDTKHGMVRGGSGGSSGDLPHPASRPEPKPGVKSQRKARGKAKRTRSNDAGRSNVTAPDDGEVVAPI